MSLDFDSFFLPKNCWAICYKKNEFNTIFLRIIKIILPDVNNVEKTSKARTDVALFHSKCKEYIGVLAWFKFNGQLNMFTSLK